MVVFITKSEMTTTKKNEFKLCPPKLVWLQKFGAKLCLSTGRVTVQTKKRAL